MQFNLDFLILLKTLDNQKRKDYSINDNGWKFEFSPCGK